RRVARPRRVGAALPVAADPRVDQRRLLAPQRLGPEAPALHRAGPEVLDEHVVLERQAPGQLAAARLAQVQRDAALVARDAAPPVRGAALVERAPGPDGIALGRLDLDDLGPEVREQGAGPG